MHITAVSPHSDDVALSLCGTLNHIGISVKHSSLTLLSCFTQTNYVAEHFTCEPDLVAGVRRMEDLSFLNRLSIKRTKLECLELLDSPLRSEWKSEHRALQDPSSYRHLEESQVTFYANKLSVLIENRIENGSLFLCPLGLVHQDHIITHIACVKALQSRPVGFYSDVPYRFYVGSAEETVRAAVASKSFGEALFSVRLAFRHDRYMWHRCLSAYCSQFQLSYLEKLEGQVEGQGELLWMNAAGLAVLDKAGLDVVRVP